MMITKANTKLEAFSPQKLATSIQHAGATPELAKDIAATIRRGLRKNTPTKKINAQVRTLLARREPATALRYRLKDALAALPAAGIPFAEYVARLLTSHGYETKTDVRLRGQCVEQHVDLIARRDGTTWFATCSTTDTGTPESLETGLTTQARTLDLRNSLEYWQDQKEGWLITAAKPEPRLHIYAHCVNLKLTGWSWPTRGSLQQLIETSACYPITILPNLRPVHLKKLVAGGFFTTADILQRKAGLSRLHLPMKVRDQLVTQAELLKD
jgi:hypothetical protein